MSPEATEKLKEQTDHGPFCDDGVNTKTDASKTGTGGDAQPLHIWHNGKCKSLLANPSLLCQVYFGGAEYQRNIVMSHEKAEGGQSRMFGGCRSTHHAVSNHSIPLLIVILSLHYVS